MTPLTETYIFTPAGSENVSPDASQRGTLRDEAAPTESESETPPIESDSEGVMMQPKPSKRRQKPESIPVSLHFSN